MPASIKQMALRRKAHGITRRELQRPLECSESWLRWLEAGLYKGPCVPKWQARYQDALDELIEKKKASR